MFDNVSKFLVERYSAEFATWLLGESIELTTLSPTELSLEPIRADALILLQSDELVLHCEFQTDPNAKIPFRMADYRLRVLMAAMSILCGLKLEGDTIRRVIRSEMMRESVIYQEIVQESEQRGELKQAQSLILRLLNRRVGNLSLELETQVKDLPLVRLEELGEALLDFSQMSDLVTWLDVARSY